MGNELRDFLIAAPNSLIDASMHPLLEKWGDPPTALQVLEVLDQCIHASLASGFVVRALQVLYDQALTREKTAHETVAKNATWRSS